MSTGRNFLASTIVVLVLVLLLVLLVVRYLQESPDYADLLPAPDTIVWEEGGETTLWLQTNRNDVDLRINSVSLGVGKIERVFPEAGAATTLGRSEGCAAWAVNRLALGSVTGSGGGRGVLVDGMVDRNGHSGVLDVYMRVYPEGADPSTSAVSQTVQVLDGADNFTWSVTVTTDEPRIFEASHADKFPEVYTRRITVDPASGEATSDTEAVGLQVPVGVGVGVIACSQHDDALITLHGERGVELARYLVDVHTKPAPVSATPPPGAGYNIRRVCVDAADDQPNYLSGGEFVGDAFDAAAFGLSGTIQSVGLADTAPENHFRYFFSYSLANGGVQLVITDAGASGLGLDADQVYTIRLTATDDSGVEDDPDTDGDEFIPDATADLDIGVWLDTSTLSPADDGHCS